MTTVAKVFWAWATVGLVGCGGSSSAGGGSTPAAGGATTFAVPTMPGDMKCYKGSANIEMANGTEVNDAPVYWRRAWDASSNTITEDAVTIANGNASRIWMSMSPNGDGFGVTGKYKGGVLSGTAMGTGEPGAWTSWTVDTELDAGAKVHSEHAAEGESINTKSVVADANGTPIMQVVQRMQLLDPDACAAAFARWEPL